MLERKKKEGVMVEGGQFIAARPDSTAEGREAPQRTMRPLQYDLSHRLYVSNRMHIAAVENRYVAFNPDYPGGPVLLSAQARAVLQAFDNGATIGDVLSEIDINLEEGLQIVDHLFDGAYLRSSVNKARYTADERLGNPISSMSIWVHINNHCNLDCSYCFVNKYKAEMNSEIIRSTTRRLRLTAESRGIRNINIAYAGGEPTLSLKRIQEFHSFLEGEFSGGEIWRHHAILTNGTNVNEDLIKFCQTHRVSTGISLDGHGDSHDKHRVFKKSRRGSWSIIENNIGRLLDAGIGTYVMVVTSAETCETLPELVDWIYQRQLPMRLSIVRQPDGVWAPKDWKKAYKRLTDKIIPAFEATFKMLEKPTYSYKWCNGIRICELHFDTPSFSTSCGIGSSHIIVQDDGNIASCPMTIRERYVEPADDLILASSKTVQISPASRNDSEEKNCLDCRWFPVCVSGCPVTNERVKGAPYAISPMHEFYDYVIPRYVEFLGRKMLQASLEVGVGGHILESKSLM